MKLIDTLEPIQITSILNIIRDGLVPRTIMLGAFRETDAFYNDIIKFDYYYYFERSGQKETSTSYKVLTEMIDKYGLNPLDVTSVNVIIGQTIRNKYLDKWNKIYNALFTNYEPLKEYEETETKVGTNTDNTEFDYTLTNNGSNTNTKEYDTTVENDEETANKQTVTKNEDGNNNIYGFNSVVSVGSETDGTVSTETTEGLAQDNTNHNTETKTGSETESQNIDETETKEATENKTYNIDETKTVSGRKQSASKLLEEEIRFRNLNIFFDILGQDFDSVCVLQVY